jgi:hypothetical protein
VTLVVALFGLLLIGSALLDAFETVVLPRRVSRRLRLGYVFYALTWRPYGAAALRIKDGMRRETFLSFYGPLSLLLLVSLWAITLILGFAALHWAIGTPLSTPEGPADFLNSAYYSGTTFFTLGLGDVVPKSGFDRFLTVVEAGTGFAFLALLIGYLPIVYQMFARRETNVSLLDQRAGSPPSAAELMRRNVVEGDLSELIMLLREWETWVGDLLESHLSYPSLAYFRSQHENQSWLGALAVILDVSSYLLACGSTPAERQAAFTFAIGRHAVGDLTGIFRLKPGNPMPDRLSPEAAHELWEAASTRGVLTEHSSAAGERLRAIRLVYEPYLQALSAYLLMDLPPWVPSAGAADNWETTATDFASPVPLLGPKSPYARKTPTDGVTE